MDKHSLLVTLIIQFVRGFSKQEDESEDDTVTSQPATSATIGGGTNTVFAMPPPSSSNVTESTNLNSGGERPDYTAITNPFAAGAAAEAAAQGGAKW